MSKHAPWLPSDCPMVKRGIWSFLQTSRGTVIYAVLWVICSGSLLFPHPLSHTQEFREEGGGSHTRISLRGWEQIHLSTLTKGALPKMTVLIKLWPSPVVSLMPWQARAFICLWLKMKALFCWCKREISWCVRLWCQTSPCHVIFRALQGGSYSLETDIPNPPDYF